MRRPTFLVTLMAAGLVGCATNVSTTPGHHGQGDWIVVRVERVQVLPTRPGSERPWDVTTDAGSRGDSGCALLGAFAAMAAPGLGAIAGGLCSMSGSDPKVLEHDPQAPDLVVVLGFGHVAYRSYVVPDRYDYPFNYEVLVPRGAVPPDGLEVSVLDQDGPGDADVDLVGLKRVPGNNLDVGQRLTLNDAGVQTLELKVEPAGPIVQHVGIDVDTADGITPTSLRFPAGAAITIRAAGSYRVGSYYDATVTPSGYPSGGPKDYNLRPSPFATAPHGAAVAVVTLGSYAEGVVVGSCVHFIARTGGALALGINDREPKNDTGRVHFEVTISLPSLEEWSETLGPQACAPP